MPTIITHPAIALCVAPCLRDLKKKPLIILSGILLTILPDLDVLAFRVGIPYSHMFGHRGFSHSICFSLFASILFVLFFNQRSFGRRLIVWGYLFICALSHGVLDAMTNGGLGVGLLIPFSVKRYFFEFRPIAVSTLSLERFFNGQGVFVLQNELRVVWAPAVILFICAFFMAKKLSMPEGERLQRSPRRR